MSSRLKPCFTASLGLVERTPFPEVPPWVEYTITSEGRDLRRTLSPVLRWAINFETYGSKAKQRVTAATRRGH